MIFVRKIVYWKFHMKLLPVAFALGYSWWKLMHVNKDNYVGYLILLNLFVRLTEEGDTQNLDTSQNSVLLEIVDLLRLCVSHIKYVKVFPDCKFIVGI